MAAGGPVTAEDLGLAGDDLWQYVSPRHVVLNLQPAGADPWFADAVLLAGRRTAWWFAFRTQQRLGSLR